MKPEIQPDIIWEGKYGQDNFSGGLLEWGRTDKKNEIIGIYLVKCTLLYGTIKGNMIEGTWTESDSGSQNGDLSFEMTKPSHFKMKYRHKEKDHNTEDEPHIIKFIKFSDNPSENLVDRYNEGMKKVLSRPVTE